MGQITAGRRPDSLLRRISRVFHIGRDVAAHSRMKIGAILHASLAAMCAACEVTSGVSSDGEVEHTGDMASPFVCDVPTTLEAVRLATGADSVELVGHSVEPPEPKSLGIAGVPCAGAPDAAACNRDLDQIRASTRGSLTMCLTGCGAYGFALFTKGGTITIAATEPELLQALGAIDSEAKALFWLLAKNYPDIDCEAPGGSWIRRVEGGFDIRRYTNHCGSENT